MAETYHRKLSENKRKIRDAFSVTLAADAIGTVERNCEIYGLSKGQFSLIDIISHCLSATGPADVVLSTWTAANADLGFAFGLLANGSIKSLRFVVDFSFPVRQPEYCAALRERFGDDAIRLTKNHAKFCLIHNADWSIVIRTSMNLNENRRLESFEISDDAGLCGYLLGVVAELFADHGAGEQFEKRPYANTVDFEAWGQDAAGAAERAGKSVDKKKYFGDGRLETDVRRAGLSFVRGGGRLGGD
jgi:hypothetical protein